MKFNAIKSDFDYYVYKNFNINLYKFVDFFNTYYPKTKFTGKIFYFDIILELTNLIEMDSFENSLKLFNILRNLKGDIILNKYLTNYLRKLIDIIIDVPGNKYFNQDFFLNCYFFLFNLKQFQIVCIPYPINYKENNKHINSNLDFELDN